MAAAATGASSETASSLNAGVAKVNILNQGLGFVDTIFKMENAMDAARTEARNAAATAEALEIERRRTLGIFDRESRNLAAEQTLAYIMSGVELSSGTPMATMEASRIEREADRSVINQNYEIQIANARAAEASAKKSKKLALAGGIAQLTGQGVGLATIFSDERLKEDLVLVGKANNGLNIYLGKYTKESGLDDGKVHLFLIAQEVQKIKPEAVKKHESGYLMVDYASALL